MHRRVGGTVNLMELEDDEIFYVLRHPGYHAVSIDLHVGSRLPAGAVNIAVPWPRWKLDDVLARLVPLLLGTAAAVQKALRQ